MILSHLRRAIWRLTHRRFVSAEDMFQKRTKFGEINEFFKRQIISADDETYSLPFLTNPFRSRKEQQFWPDLDSLGYEYDADHRHLSEAMRHFEIAYEMVKDRIGSEDTIFDVGCSSGFFLEQWQKKGFTKLHGLDPQRRAIEYAREHRPDLRVTEGFFGPPENDVACELLVFFQTIFRIPYEEGLFEAIDRCAKKYVLVAWVEDSTNLFVRDLHVGLAKKGLLCIEKRVHNRNFRPFGTEESDGPMIGKTEISRYDPLFTSHFLFRRIEPRP